MADGDLLRDHAAQRHADDVGALYERRPITAMATSAMTEVENVNRADVDAPAPRLSIVIVRYPAPASSYTTSRDLTLTPRRAVERKAHHEQHGGRVEAPAGKVVMQARPVPGADGRHPPPLPGASVVQALVSA